MSAHSDPKQLPAVWRPPQGGSDIQYHQHEWTSGTQGGGKVPADFEWTSNPRVYAEDFGANVHPFQVSEPIPAAAPAAKGAPGAPAHAASSTSIAGPAQNPGAAANGAEGQKSSATKS